MDLKNKLSDTKWKYFIDNSGDSELLKIIYDTDECIKINIYHDSFDSNANIVVNTEKIILKRLNKDIPNVCYLNLVELKNELLTHKGYYVPSNEFKKIMKEGKEGLSLAYGMREAEYKYLFSIQGYRTYLICLVREKSDIDIFLNEIDGSVASDETEED